MKTLKRLTTLLLVLCMVLPAVPAQVLAISSSEVASQSSDIPIAIGDCITLGTYMGEPIVWRCVDIDEHGPLMLSEKILCNKAYDAAGESSKYHTDGWGYIRKERGSNCWSDSSIRQWLNSSGSVAYTHCPPAYKDELGFLSNFSASELALVKTVTQKSYLNEWETHRTGYVDGGTKEPSHINDIAKLNDDTSSYWYQNVTDKFFLLERNQLFNIYENNPEYLYADATYFTRYVGNAGASYENIFGVGTTKNFTYCAAPSSALGIRPAFYLNARGNDSANNKCGENLFWSLDDNGTLTISGTGAMDDFRWEDIPWYEHKDTIYKVIICDGVTSIGDYAFFECENIMSITIPESVIAIGTDALFPYESLNYNVYDNAKYVGNEQNPFLVLMLYGSEDITSCQIHPQTRFISDIAFAGTGLTSIMIPNSVTSIGNYAFLECDSLTSVTILDGVINIGGCAFANCSSLTSVTIPDSVTTIGECAFDFCNNLECNIYDNAKYLGNDINPFVALIESVTNSITSCQIRPETKVIAAGAFYDCSSLESITVPKSITTIGECTFLDCGNLKSITIPDSVATIGYAAFHRCYSLTDVYYSGTEEQWKRISIDNHNSFNETLTNATIHFGRGNTLVNNKIAGLTIEKAFENFYVFLGDSAVYNMDAPDKGNIHTDLIVPFDNIAHIDEDVLSPDDITWTSSNESILRVISSGGTGYPVVNLHVEGLKEGTATLTAANPAGETLSFEVTVVKPNALAFANIYDTKQYYSDGGFYSAESSISDSVEIFMQFDNAIKDGYPCKVEENLAKNISVIEPITLTAKVNGSDLSFERNSYQNTYTRTYDAIEFDKCVYDILTLFPTDVSDFDVEYGGRSYSVEITLESDSFYEPIKEVYTFTIYDIETQRVGDHIKFANTSEYKVLKQNIYGSNMVTLKDDGEYKWSKWTTFDFDNYYEIVLTDMLLGMLGAQQVNTSITPKVLKDWYGTYKSLLGNITTMVSDSYADVLDVSEMKIDKVLKISKYSKTSNAKYADDDLFRVVVDFFGRTSNIDKIRTCFAAVDETQKVFSVVKLTGDLVKDFLNWGNTISVLNAFAETDEEFRQVFRDVANRIPASKKKMKDAIEDYLNYSENNEGMVSEIYESFAKMGIKVAWDTFEGIVGKNVVDWSVAKVISWVGTKTISGGTATIASTTAFSAFTTTVGSVATGFTLGLRLSDFICNSGDKAAEMGKIIAMSEYTPYIIETLEFYENNLYNAADENSVVLFEKAFGLHQASQSYIVDHTIKALEAKADSILYIILGNDNYDQLVSEILVQKNAIDSMTCCKPNETNTLVNNRKVIAVKCPVDVFVYSEDGREVVRIVADNLQYAQDGISVYIRDRAKYIALSTDQTYSVKIVATEEGTMDYLVTEFDDQLQFNRTVKEQDITLSDGRLFGGEVAPELNIEDSSYALTYCDHSTVENNTCTECGGTIGTVVVDSDGNELGKCITLSDALILAAAGGTIYLQTDITEENVVLLPDVNLDLNGHTVTADSVLTYSSSAIIDTSEDVSGLLKINDDDGNMISEDNSQLPVYDAENDGYRFFAMDVQPCAVTGGNKYWFRIKAEKFAPLYDLIQADSDVQIKVKMTWDGQTEDTYAVANLSFTKTWAESYNANEDIYVTVKVDEVEGLENFKLIPMITSGGVEIPGEEM